MASVAPECSQFNAHHYDAEMKNNFSSTCTSTTTMPPEAPKITSNFDLNRPANVTDELTLKGTKQFYVDVVREERKLDALTDLLNASKALGIIQSVIFINTKRKLDWLTDLLRGRNHKVGAIHELMDQTFRNTVVHEFQSGSSPLLITTDVMASGIDLERVSLVLNYDLPLHPANYLHRVGRIGCLEQQGLAMSFVTKEDERMLMDIQRFFNTVIEEVLPDVADLAGVAFTSDPDRREKLLKGQKLASLTTKCLSLDKLVSYYMYRNPRNSWDKYGSKFR